MREFLFIGLAGALGTWSRYGVHLLAKRYAVGAVGTFLVNILGCLLLALLLEHPYAERIFPRVVRVSLAVGFFGAFTTFSTFGYETMQFFEQGEWQFGFLNVFANLLGGALAVWAGFRWSLSFS
ncbi:MAG: CrcB family protein [Bdellovibrionaceae bacterium]|nr:CrcB family protein [Pseudobdellovibrionaceae bacterium]